MDLLTLGERATTGQCMNIALAALMFRGLMALCGPSSDEHLGKHQGHNLSCEPLS